ncbi:MAG: MBL fold metallo-hydrolase [Silvanigrellales bacterium]|nr:MBL fold metallo-hydrolase [Silvanigrellales bacterium]
MKAFHFDCGRTCPRGLGLFGKAFTSVAPPSFVTRVTLLETSEGPILIDAGYPRHFLAAPERYFVRWAALRPQAGVEQSAAERLKAVGVNPRDVRHILLTHLDYDHVGGVVDFPSATLHVLDAEVAAAKAPRLGFERLRYRDVESVLAGRRLVTVRSFAHPWHGTVSAAPLAPLASVLRFVPLPGHARGHAGIAYATDMGASAIDAFSSAPEKEGFSLASWTLHAGDAYFDDRELDLVPFSPSGLVSGRRELLPESSPEFASAAAFRLLVRATSLLHADASQAARTLLLLKRLRGEGLRIQCSHDAAGFLAPPVGRVPNSMERDHP